MFHGPILLARQKQRKQLTKRCQRWLTIPIVLLSVQAIEIVRYLPGQKCLKHPNSQLLVLSRHQVI